MILQSGTKARSACSKPNLNLLHPLQWQRPVAPVAPVKYSRKNPYPSELTERVMLNGEGSAKETIHLEFSLEGSGLEYETGDALAVVPHNAEDVVNAIIETTKLVADAPVRVKEQEYTLQQALTSQLDVTAISLPVLKRYNEIAKDAKLAAMLDPAKKADLQAYLHGREIIDVLNDFPAKRDHSRCPCRYHAETAAAALLDRVQSEGTPGRSSSHRRRRPIRCPWPSAQRRLFYLFVRPHCRGRQGRRIRHCEQTLQDPRRQRCSHDHGWSWHLVSPPSALSWKSAKPSARKAKIGSSSVTSTT
jgi:hypothetical protein